MLVETNVFSYVAVGPPSVAAAFRRVTVEGVLLPGGDDVAELGLVIAETAADVGFDLESRCASRRRY